MENIVEALILLAAGAYGLVSGVGRLRKTSEDMKDGYTFYKTRLGEAVEADREKEPFRFRISIGVQVIQGLLGVVIGLFCLFMLFARFFGG